MPRETPVTLILESASLYDALRAHLGEWSLQDHVFDPDVDEVRVSYDVSGSGRVGLTLGFELTEAQMAELLRAAAPAARASAELG
jgi:hypothetical protein